MNIATAIEYRKNGEYEHARDILEQMLVFAPKDAQLHYHMAVTCGMQGDETPALEHYRAALEAGLPDQEEGQAVLATTATLRSQGRFLEAARFLRKMLERRPNDDGLRAFLALTLHKLGMHSEALQTVIRLLVTTSESKHIRSLAPVLSFYADSLDQRTGSRSA